jgi:hypothetical protein
MSFEIRYIPALSIVIDYKFIRFEVGDRISGTVGNIDLDKLQDDRDLMLEFLGYQ